MGWAYGTADDGREVGYSVEADCEADGCEAQIDRGLAYECGERTEHGCGHHFCAMHLFIGADVDGQGSCQLCPSCFDEAEAEDAS